MIRQSTPPALVKNWQMSRSNPSRTLTAETDKSVLITAVDEPFFASATCTIVDDGLRHHPLTYCDILYTSPNFFNHSAELMATRHWDFLSRDGVRRGWYYVWASQILVKVFIEFFRGSIRSSSPGELLTCSTYTNIGGFDLFCDR